MSTHASRDTTTGIRFEKASDFYRTDATVRLQQGAFAKWIEKMGGQNLAWEFRPDDAYYFADTNEVVIYEKKTQSKKGSCDEKLAACEWRLQDYRTILATIGVPPEKVKMIYIFGTDWFKTPKYATLLAYMESKGCEYFFWNDNDEKKERLMNYRYSYN